MPLIERLVKRSFLFRPLVRRFIAGDTLEQAIEQVRPLTEHGFFASLDYLGENTRTPAEAEAASSTYIQMARQIPLALPDRDVNISIKLTQCGLDISDELATAGYTALLQEAAKPNVFVRVDMESSLYTQRTIEIVSSAFSRYQNTGTVLQSYLYRTPEDVRKMIELQARTRLVKGAYLEPSTVAFPDKRKVDEAYVRLAKELLLEGYYPALATHDERIIAELLAFIKERGIAASKFEFQMLYGVRRDLHERLRSQGYNMRVYVPFGDQWYPYFTRRLAERPANMFFLLRSLFRG